jgi:transketolase
MVMGELQEGQIWEAAMYAAANNVDNLIATIDYNGRQIDGDVEDVMSLGNLAQKWLAFGWVVLEMDGHKFEDIRAKMTEAKAMCGKRKASGHYYENRNGSRCGLHDGVS